MRPTKLVKFTILRSDDSIEVFKLPEFITPHEVMAHRRHSLVFVHVPRGMGFYVDGPGDQACNGAIGPCIVLGSDGKLWGPIPCDTDISTAERCYAVERMYSNDIALHVPLSDRSKANGTSSFGRPAGVRGDG